MKKYYDVERILEKDENNGIPLYLVKWLGYPLKEATWEPKSNLVNVKYMIEEYDKSLKKKKNKESVTLKGEKREDKSKISKENLVISQNEKDKEKEHNNRHPIDPDLKNLFFPNPKIDTPLQIVDTLKIDKNVYFEISWKVRPDGIEPYNTSMTFHQVKEKYPHILLEYLESKNINLY
jgi:hypothetical protein